MRLNGVDFHVEVDGHGPPLLLLHGFTGSTRAWDGLIPELRADWQVITVDLIGHGMSESPAAPERYTLEWAARDLGALLDALDLGAATVLGYSMGGRVALHFAVSVPERVSALVLESASPGIEDDLERAKRVRADEALAQRILDNGIDAFVAEWEQQPLLALAPHVSEAVRDQQHTQRVQNNPLGLANSLRGMGAGQQRPLWAELGALESMPVLLMAGALDARYTRVAERMHALLPHSELEIVSQAGHTVHLDQPLTFGRLVKKLTQPGSVVIFPPNACSR